MSGEVPDWAEGEALRIDAETLARTIVLSCQYAWPKDREKSVEKATRLINSFLDGHTAYARGRKEGIEEAAKVADRRTVEPDPDEEDPYDEWEMGGRSSARFIATAIRQLLEVKG